MVSTYSIIKADILIMDVLDNRAYMAEWSRTSLIVWLIWQHGHAHHT